jgi:multidrug efflux pump subunit AcrA (membrane-fusion protein)
MRNVLLTLAGQVQAEQQATLDAAVFAAQQAATTAAEAKAATQLEAAAQREAARQAKAAAATAALQHELESARHETAQLKAAAEREARRRLEATTKGTHKKVTEAAPTQLSQGSPPGAAFRASGAGTEKCNGWYKQFGTCNENEKPTYYKASGFDTNLLGPTLLLTHWTASEPHCSERVTLQRASHIAQRASRIAQRANKMFKCERGVQTDQQEGWGQTP